MKKAAIFALLIIMLIAGCSSNENTLASYSPEEIKQILVDNDFEYVDMDSLGFGYIKDSIVISSEFPSESTYSFTFKKEGKEYHESFDFNSKKSSAFAVIEIGEKDCYYDFDKEEISKISPEGCGNLTVEKAKEIKVDFDDFLVQLSISKEDFIKFIQTK